MPRQHSAGPQLNDLTSPWSPTRTPDDRNILTSVSIALEEAAHQGRGSTDSQWGGTGRFLNGEKPADLADAANDR
jgi:hypothetical protein